MRRIPPIHQPTLNNDYDSYFGGDNGNNSYTGYDITRMFLTP